MTVPDSRTLWCRAMKDDLDGIVREFLIESHEGLDRIDHDLIALEKSPQDSERLASVFRAIHTIKGTCGFFDFHRLGALTHSGENLLSELRDGHRAFTPEVATTLLQLVDAVRRSLAHIERTGSECDEDYSLLIDRLARLQTSGELASVVNASPATGPGGFDELTAGAVAESNIRVDVGLLDKLMNLVGELVLARNRIQQFTNIRLDSEFGQAAQRLNVITSELQEGVMKTRMQPIGTVWSRIPRVVRDLASACGKDVRIVMEGNDTELDKSILEAIKDPLTHLVRNAVDHGLEPTAERKKAGKSETGLVVLRAYHEGGQVIIEVTDDGCGMDSDRIRRKAIERGFHSADAVAQLTERDALRLIFLPGFSTAESVTTISGRGVGMDVVKTNIEKIGGTIDLQTRPGHGTTVKIKIPLTLAIIPALIVGTGGDRYAIPQVNLLELVRLSPEQARQQIELLYGVPVYRLRGNLLPLVYLDRILGVDPPAADDAVFVVVLQAEDRPFGLVVAAVHDTEEIVVKPLGKHMKGIPLYAGATILGDGHVSLILDAVGLARSTGVVTGDRDHPTAVPDRQSADSTASQTVLLFDVADGYRMALPLNQVSRLEEIPAEAVEFASGREVLQYRGSILPIVRLARLLPIGSRTVSERDKLQVVVYANAGHCVGLVVCRILDVVEARIEAGNPSRVPGIQGTSIIHGKVTDLLDASCLIRNAGLNHGAAEAGGLSA